MNANTSEQVRTIGRNLRRARKAAGLTQSQLAERVGVVQSYVGQIERSERNVTLEVLLSLCTAAKTNLADLMRDPNDNPQPDRECADSELQDDLRAVA